MCRYLFVLLLLITWQDQALAETNCPPPKSYKDLISCAESNSPEVQKANLELDRATAGKQSAGQWKNPELSVESFPGKLNNKDSGETDTSLGIPLELGGKISARTDVAEGAISLAEAKLYEAKAKVRTQIYLKLHRYRQVLHEQEIVDEAVGTFSKLISQYSKRSGLSPEQQVSSSVFQLSKSEYDLKKSNSLDEILSLDSYFKINLGLGAEQVRAILPSSPKAWPKVVSVSGKPASPEIQILKAELQTAKAELAVARSESWPTLVVGPSLKMQKESGKSENLWGINLSLPLPIFNANGGGRAAALAGVSVSESRTRFAEREQSLRREELQKIYDQSVKSLTESLSHNEIEKRHTDAEKLFTRGVVPSALVIEAHRTSFELERTRHERELKAFETLLELYSIDGNILEVSL